MNIDRKLPLFIEERILLPPDVERFKLYHSGSGPNEADLIHTFSVKLEEGKAEQEAERIAVDALKRAKDHVESFGGQTEAAQRYKLVAFSKGNKRGAQFAWSERPSHTLRDVGSTDPPTSAGIIAHLLRHDSEAHNTLVAAIAPLMAESANVIREQRKSLDVLIAGQVEFIRAREEVLGRKQERQIELIEATGRQEAQSRIVKSLTESVIPQISSKLIGHLLKAPAKEKTAPKKSEANGEAGNAEETIDTEAETPMSSDERSKLRKILLGLPEEAAAVLIKNLSEKDQAEMMAILDPSRNTQ
jgi:hypothetical protein